MNNVQNFEVRTCKKWLSGKKLSENMRWDE